MIPMLGNRANPTAFDAVSELRREIERWFDDAAGSGLDSWRLPAEVVDTGEGLRFDVELPGVRPEDVDLTIEENVLTIAGEKRTQREEAAGGGSHRLLERRYGRFERVFVLPRHVDTSKVEARLEHGVLTVVLPKVEAARPRKIPVTGDRRKAGEDGDT